MSTYWLLFASLSVIGSLVYNVNVKLGTASMNVFAFVFALSGTVFVLQTIALLVAKFGFGFDIARGATPQTLKYAVMAGMGAALIDVAYFFAVRNGSLIATQIFWTVGGIIALATFSVCFLGETISGTKALGVVFGIASVLLITRA